MGLIKDLKTKTIESLTNITDALYENDPEGTDANEAYFTGNVHNYLKHVGLVLQPENSKYVSSEFTVGTSNSLGDPFYTDISTCYDAITDSSVTAKAYVLLLNRGSAFSENLTLSKTNGYIIFKGDSKFGTVLDGTLTISDGTHIFRNIKFTNTITISGGKAVFENCTQPEGGFNITGNSTVIITKADHWGYIVISDGLTNLKLWCEDILNMSAYEPAAGEFLSINVPSTLTNPEIILRRVAAQGDLLDDGDLVDEISGLELYITARPII